MTATKRFIGQMRLPGRDWQAVVTAGTEDAAWQLLHDYAVRSGERMVDLAVVEAGADPDTPFDGPDSPPQPAQPVAKREPPRRRRHDAEQARLF